MHEVLCATLDGYQRLCLVKVSSELASSLALCTHHLPPATVVMVCAIELQVLLLTLEELIGKLLLIVGVSTQLYFLLVNGCLHNIECCVLPLCSTRATKSSCECYCYNVLY